MAAGDGSEKIVPREEAPVDVSARSGPRVVFPPLNPNSNPPSRRWARRRQPFRAVRTARCRTPSRARSKPSPFAAISLTALRCRCRQRPGRCIPRQAGGLREDRSGHSGRAAKPEVDRRIRQCQRQRAAVAESARRAGHPGGGSADARRQYQPGPGRARARRVWRQLRRSGFLATQRGRRAGFLPRAAGQIPDRPRIARAIDQARRPRRQRGLLPRHGRAVRIARRGLAVLRQPEDRGRSVRRPKELAAGWATCC